MQTELSTNLINVADILEKTAVYLDKLETKEADDKKDHINKEYVTPVVEKMAEAVGFDIDENMAEKLANVDPDILDMMKRLATKSTSEDNVTLGGPARDIVKLSSITDDDEDAILKFCLGD